MGGENLLMTNICEIKVSDYTRSISWNNAGAYSALAGDEFFPQVSFEADGDALVVWNRTEGKPGIYSRRFNNDLSCWERRKLVSSKDAFTYFDDIGPTLATGPDGGSLAVWLQGALPGLPLPAAVYANVNKNGNWGEPKPISEGLAGDAHSPNVVFSDSGEAMAVWWQMEYVRQVPHDKLAFSVYDPEEGWGVAALAGNYIYADKSNYMELPSVIADASGQFFLFWQNSDKLFSARFDGSGWLDITPVSSDEAFAGYPPALSADQDGNVVSVMPVMSGSMEVSANIYLAGIGWQGPEPLSGAGLDAGVPSVSFNSDGNAVAIWGEGASICFNVYDKDIGWTGSSEFEALEDDEVLWSTSIKSDNAGNSIAVWMSSKRIRSAVHNAESGWGKFKTLVQEGGFVMFDNGPSYLSIGPSGNAFAVWSQKNPSEQDFNIKGVFFK